jgi:hypothetical protein
MAPSITAQAVDAALQARCVLADQAEQLELL